jgi:hypothetical protein
MTLDTPAAVWYTLPDSNREGGEWMSVICK